MKKLALLTALFFLLSGNAFAANQTIAATEEMVGSGHPTKTDTLNRLVLVDHNTDGTHKTLSLQNIVEDTTPQLGGNLDTNKKLILLNATLNDHEAEGRAVTGTAGEDLAQSDIVYKKLNGGAWKWYKYDANGTYKLILPSGIATAAITSGNSGIILLSGQMRDDTWALSPSADTAVTVYASGTAGGVTLTAPSTAGDEVIVVGLLVGGNTIQTAFGYAWVEK